MDTSDTQAEAVKTDIITARDHLRAAAVLLKRLNETGQGSEELKQTETTTNQAIHWLKVHGHDGQWNS